MEDIKSQNKEKSLSWITFTDKIIMRDFDECSCKICNAPYDHRSQLHYIKDLNDLHYTFCKECYIKILYDLDDVIELYKTNQI